MPLTRSPQADEQERRDERQFVKGVEEEQILRRERAGAARGNEKDARVEKVGTLLNLRGHPDSSQCNRNKKRGRKIQPGKR